MIHGGNLHDAKALFPEAPEPWLDLSTGINPSPYPFAFKDLDAFTRLPSAQDVRILEGIAASTYGVLHPSRVAATPGSQAVIQLIPRLRSTGRVAIVGPTYSEHAKCWTRAGHQCFAAQTLTGALNQQPDVIVLVNPNNPDGRVIPAGELAIAASDLHDRGGWLVIDEAFADLESGVSVAHRALPGTIILRSFGKTYGLAGIRLGFVISDPGLAEEIRAQFGLWAISGPALEIAAVALSDSAWLEKQKTVLGAGVLELDRVLASAGFNVVGGTLLFRLARHPDASSTFDDLARAGVWVRKFPHDQTSMRFGVPTPNALLRLNKALLKSTL